ncbi:DUF805 domain-containing protein [uncultured Veillonella sp.]|uniref:DUF805 domain-containing protein n=1 Tax=uncultured Veillonella sp. TaxID=159268 RepID=UPI002591D246|nr:DUF805 domain-containing protein [uncultured Veillonella sp.]
MKISAVSRRFVDSSLFPSCMSRELYIFFCIVIWETIFVWEAIRVLLVVNGNWDCYAVVIRCFQIITYLFTYYLLALRVQDVELSKWWSLAAAVITGVGSWLQGLWNISLWWSMSDMSIFILAIYEIIKVPALLLKSKNEYNHHKKQMEQAIFANDKLERLTNRYENMSMSMTVIHVLVLVWLLFIYGGIVLLKIGQPYSGIAICIPLITVLYVYMKRLHVFGKSSWWLCTLPIPLLNMYPLYFIFYKGKEDVYQEARKNVKRK